MARFAGTGTQMHPLGRSLVAALLLACAAADIVDKVQQVVYDRGPKIRLTGGPFKGSDKQIHLTFFPALEQGVDYTLSVLDESRIVLSLNDGKR